VKELIRSLTECFGPSGYEGAVRELIKRELPPGAGTHVDAMGNLIVHYADAKGGTGGTGGTGGRRIMIAAHMDEIGIVVTHVEQKGFVRFGSVGGVFPLPLTGGRVQFANGITGVIGLDKLDDSSRVPPME
jgi:tetrahedral aminopeptidase